MVTVRVIYTETDSHLTKDYMSKFGNGKIFVETGTYHGDTVKLALEFGYDQIHSVELNDELYTKAVEMFKDNSKVKIWHGDSAEMLTEIIKEIGNEPATFWLDAHASGDLVGGKSGGTPVVDELKAIGESLCKEHSIFIDDRRLFGSAEWSFVTEKQAFEELMKINPKYTVLALDGHVKQDVMCATTRNVE